MMLISSIACQACGVSKLTFGMLHGPWTSQNGLLQPTRHMYNVLYTSIIQYET